MKQLLFLAVGGYISTGSTPLICLLKEYKGVEVLEGELRVGESGLYTLIGKLMKGEKAEEKEIDNIKYIALDYGKATNSVVSILLSLIVRVPGCPKLIAEKISRYRLKFRSYSKKVVDYNETIKSLFKVLYSVNEKIETLSTDERFSRLSAALQSAVENIKIKNMINDNNLLVIDQLISPKVLFSDEYAPLIARLVPDAKVIIVKRDPRDQYIDLIQKHKKEYHLMNHSNSLNEYLEEFKKRYDRMTFLADKNHANNILFVWFEDLVNNYERTNGEIAKFLNLDSHDEKFKYFYPGIATSYVGMYTSYKHQQDIDKIAHVMHDHLYDSGI